ncbi:MAG: 6-phosphogluconolactonase, partial [Dehalococcoidia bacterium]
GTNGHVAFNEPGSTRDSHARTVDLAPASREVHAATFGSIDAVPDRGMTLGMSDLLAARAVLVLASGAHKAAIVRDAIEGPETEDVPASLLRSHADLTWVLDEAATSQLSRR